MNMSVQRRFFRLERGFVESYRSIAPPFGFNGLGELVYYRTYSRTKPGTNEKERWHETIERVVNGCYNLQESHAKQNGLHFPADKLQEEAQEMYDR